LLPCCLVNTPANDSACSANLDADTARCAECEDVPVLAAASPVSFPCFCCLRSCRSCQKDRPAQVCPRRAEGQSGKVSGVVRKARRSDVLLLRGRGDAPLHRTQIGLGRPAGKAGLRRRCRVRRGRGGRFRLFRRTSGQQAGRCGKDRQRGGSPALSCRIGHWFVFTPIRLS
jgi:hypothetical protein